MNQRRRVLRTIAAALAGAWGLIASPLARTQGAPDDIPAADNGNATDEARDRLIRDLNRLGSRDYSEQGIAVILACENVPAPVDFRPLTENSVLSARFRESADLLSAVRTDLAEADVAAIVEALADRDFNAGQPGGMQ